MLRKLDPEARTSVDLSSLWKLAGFNLRMLDVRMMRTTTDALARIGLTPASATVLLVLDANPGLQHGKLADALLVQRPNMTKLVKRLEARRLVSRGASPGDRRQIVLGLTSAGRRLAEQAFDIFNVHDAAMFAALKPAERRQFTRFVGRVLAGLEADESTGN